MKTCGYLRSAPLPVRGSQVSCHYSAQAAIVEFRPHSLSVHGFPRPLAALVGVLTVALPAGFAELRLELRQRNSLLAYNVYDLRFHDRGPRRFGQIPRRRLVDIILD